MASAHMRTNNCLLLYVLHAKLSVNTFITERCLSGSVANAWRIGARLGAAESATLETWSQLNLKNKGKKEV